MDDMYLLLAIKALVTSWMRPYRIVSRLGSGIVKLQKSVPLGVTSPLYFLPRTL